MGLARAWGTRKPVWCAWQVNYRCNFHCHFCHYWHDAMGDLPETTVEQFQEGARKLAEWGSVLVSLAGGEPLMRPDIVDVVRAVGEYHFTFMTTNGWFATPELAAELFDSGMWGVSVSIDYADAERHDTKRGMPGAHARALAAIDYFSRARRWKWQRVNWMSVLLDDNLDQIEPMIEMAAARGAYFMLQPYCDLKTGATRFRHQGQSASEYLLALRRKHANFLSNPYFLSRFDAALNGGVPGCMAGRGFSTSTPRATSRCASRSVPARWPIFSGTRRPRSSAACTRTRRRGSARRAGTTVAARSRACTIRGA
jgi:MoaA/NifB/PqqE/SkfB family radical SAM enzyme